MKVEEEIEFIKNLVNAHFNDGYHLIQAKDSQESVEQQVKRTQNRQVRIVMGILAFICLSIGINGLLHFDAFHELVGPMTLPADSKLILSGLTIFGIIFALIGIDPTLVMKMSCQHEASAIVNRSDGKYGNLLPDTYRQKAVDNFVKNV